MGRENTRGRVCAPHIEAMHAVIRAHAETRSCIGVSCMHCSEQAADTNPTVDS